MGFTVSRILAEPFYEVAQRYNPQIFAVSEREKVGVNTFPRAKTSNHCPWKGGLPGPSAGRRLNMCLMAALLLGHDGPGDC